MSYPDVLALFVAAIVLGLLYAFLNHEPPRSILCPPGSTPMHAGAKPVCVVTLPPRRA